MAVARPGDDLSLVEVPSEWTDVESREQAHVFLDRLLDVHERQMADHAEAGISSLSG